MAASMAGHFESEQVQAFATPLAIAAHPQRVLGPTGRGFATFSSPAVMAQYNAVSLGWSKGPIW